MTLRSIQHEEDGSNESVLDTEIRYRRERDDYVIEYDEADDAGFENSRMQLRVTPDGMVSIIRTGEYQTHLVAQSGKKHFCHYETPFGEFAVGVLAKYVSSTLDETGGRLELRYSVDANSTLLSDNEIQIEVRKMMI